MQIVPLTPLLVKEVAEIEKLSFSEPWSETAYLEACEKEDYAYLVAVEGEGKVLGMCGLIIGPYEAEVMNVAVHPDYRGKGISNKLMEALLDLGEKRGVSEYTLEVRVTNKAAIHLYEKFGFVGEGIRPNFYNKPTEDALIMWKKRR